LMRLGYEPDRNQWGRPETLVPAALTGSSAAQPRVSPDGRWLSFCLCPYSCWPTYQTGSDLYLVDLRAAAQTGQFTPRKMELNSDQCESWHSWSSSSRWLVFSSKRGHPLFNRPYLAYVDRQGKCGKPFIVPQRDPAFFDAQLKTYTMPTLATTPVLVSEKQLVRTIMNTNSPRVILPGR
jgi:hypothetical protein